MSEPPQARGPGFEAPRFQACYRHADRNTGISCQRCDRPICGECMQPASVGFQCPDCVRRDRSSVRAPRTRFGGALTSGSAPMTKILMGVLAGAYVLNLISSGLVANLLVLANFRVYGGEYWRLLTYGFSTYGLLHLLMSGLVLWIAGRTLEAVLGRWRFLALFVLSGLGGATGLFVFGPPELVAVGASAAVVGLLAANGIVKLRAGEDIRGDIGLLVLLLLYSFVMGFGGYLWIGQLGGMAVGALTGYVLAFAPRDRRTTVQALGLAGVAVLCAAAVVLRVSLGVG